MIWVGVRKRSEEGVRMSWRLSGWERKVLMSSGSLMVATEPVQRISTLGCAGLKARGVMMVGGGADGLWWGLGTLRAWRGDAADGARLGQCVPQGMWTHTISRYWTGIAATASMYQESFLNVRSVLSANVVSIQPDSDMLVISHEILHTSSDTVRIKQPLAFAAVCRLSIGFCLTTRRFPNQTSLSGPHLRQTAAPPSHAAAAVLPTSCATARTSSNM